MFDLGRQPPAVQEELLNDTLKLSEEAKELIRNANGNSQYKQAIFDHIKNLKQDFPEGSAQYDSAVSNLLGQVLDANAKVFATDPEGKKVLLKAYGGEKASPLWRKHFSEYFPQAHNAGSAAPTPDVKPAGAAPEPKTASPSTESRAHAHPGQSEAPNVGHETEEVFSKAGKWSTHMKVGVGAAAVAAVAAGGWVLLHKSEKEKSSEPSSPGH